MYYIYYYISEDTNILFQNLSEVSTSKNTNDKFDLGCESNQ